MRVDAAAHASGLGPTRPSVSLSFALRAGVAQAGPAARFVRNVVLVVALGGGPAADRAGAGRVPHLRQMRQHDPGVVAFGFMPVVAGVGGGRVDRDN